MDSSLRRARTLVASLLTVVTLTVAAPAADAGDRVTIAVAGDSVSEGYTTPGSLRLAFVPNIADALVRRGFARGGVGLVPAMPFRWRFSRAVGANASSVPPGAWRLMGFGIDVKGLDGASTYSAVAESPKAVATASVRGPNVRLLFTTTPTPTPFRVRAGNKTWELDTYAPGPVRPVGFSLRLPPGARRLVVNGPSRGTLTLTGALDRRPAPADKVQVEVNNLAHAGMLPQNSLAPRVVESISALSPDVTVLNWGYFAELVVDAKPAPGDLGDRYAYGLLARARLATRDGGRCIVADTSPIPVPAVVARRFTEIHKQVAAEAGCVYTDALSRLWTDPQTAFERGFTQVDDVHPSPASYRRMAEVLAPTIKRLALERLAERKAAG